MHFRVGKCTDPRVTPPRGLHILFSWRAAAIQRLNFLKPRPRSVLSACIATRRTQQNFDPPLDHVAFSRAPPNFNPSANRIANRTRHHRPPWTKKPRPASTQRRLLASGAPGGRSTRWCRTGYATTSAGAAPSGAGPLLTPPAQGYELAEDEVKISLDRFRNVYTNDDGSAKYAPSNITQLAVPTLN